MRLAQFLLQLLQLVFRLCLCFQYCPQPFLLLDTYRIPGMQDTPQIDVILTPVVSGINSVGMMGLGEPATVPTAAAVANAVFHAIGVQVLELPMTPARVLAALEGKAS